MYIHFVLYITDTPVIVHTDILYTVIKMKNLFIPEGPKKFKKGPKFGQIKNKR